MKFNQRVLLFNAEARWPDLIPVASTVARMSCGWLERKNLICGGKKKTINKKLAEVIFLLLLIRLSCTALSVLVGCVVSRAPRRGSAQGGHFVSGAMRGFGRCHFDYISESVLVSSAAGRRKDIFAAADTTNCMHPGIFVKCKKKIIWSQIHIVCPR